MRASTILALFLVSLCALSIRADDWALMPPTMDSVCDSCSSNPSSCTNSMNVTYQYCGTGSLQNQFTTRTGNQCCLNIDAAANNDVFACLEHSGNFTAVDGNWYVVNSHACGDMSKGKGLWIFELALWAMILFFVAVIGVPLLILVCCLYWCCCRRRRDAYQTRYVAQSNDSGSAYYAW